MITNFYVNDATFVNYSEGRLDLRDYRLVRVRLEAHGTFDLEILWSSRSSNNQFQMLFTDLNDFVVTPRDKAYPADSRVRLGLAGFTNSVTSAANLSVTSEADGSDAYFALLMDDQSAYFVNARLGHIQLI